MLEEGECDGYGDGQREWRRQRNDPSAFRNQAGRRISKFHPPPLPSLPTSPDSTPPLSSMPFSKPTTVLKNHSLNLFHNNQIIDAINSVVLFGCVELDIISFSFYVCHFSFWWFHQLGKHVKTVPICSVLLYRRLVI